MKSITLTQGKVALIDDEDYEMINKYRWYAASSGIYKIFYAKRKYTKDGRPYWIYMHHFIIGKPQRGFVIDHINGNGLDNRRDNLRIVTPRQNVLNSHTGREFCGVCWEKQCNKWKARITVDGKSIYLGIYDNKKDACEAFENARRLIETEITSKSVNETKAVQKRHSLSS